jgi:hypothetical protein
MINSLKHLFHHFTRRQKLSLWWECINLRCCCFKYDTMKPFSETYSLKYIFSLFWKRKTIRIRSSLDIEFSLQKFSTRKSRELYENCSQFAVFFTKILPSRRVFMTQERKFSSSNDAKVCENWVKLVERVQNFLHRISFPSFFFIFVKLVSLKNDVAAHRSH